MAGTKQYKRNTKAKALKSEERKKKSRYKSVTD